MKFSNSDFHLMRWSFAAIGVSIILSSIILYGSNEYVDATQKEQHVAQSQLNDARNQLAMAHQDQQSLSTFPQAYDILEKNKILGDNHRLDWMEGLEKLHTQNLVLDFRYSIAPQKTYTPQPAIDSGNYDIHYSETKLQFDLLHEGQLLKFFEALRSQIKGRYQIEGCSLERIQADSKSEASTSDVATARIKAECSGGWITLKNRNAQ